MLHSLNCYKHNLKCRLESQHFLLSKKKRTKAKVFHESAFTAFRPTVDSMDSCTLSIKHFNIPKEIGIIIIRF